MARERRIIPAATAVATALATGILLTSNVTSAAATTSAPTTHRHPATTKAPNNKQTVHPRIGCGGGDGVVGWGGWGSIAVPGYLEYDGNVYNACYSGTVYIFMEWDTNGSFHNKAIGSAGARKNHRVSWTTEDDFGTYAHIKITACESYKGWRCGPTISM